MAALPGEISNPSRGPRIHARRIDGDDRRSVNPRTFDLKLSKVQDKSVSLIGGDQDLLTISQLEVASQWGRNSHD